MYTDNDHNFKNIWPAEIFFWSPHVIALVYTKIQKCLKIVAFLIIWNMYTSTIFCRSSKRWEEIVCAQNMLLIVRQIWVKMFDYFSVYPSPFYLHPLDQLFVQQKHWKRLFTWRKKIAALVSLCLGWDYFFKPGAGREKFNWRC